MNLLKMYVLWFKMLWQRMGRSSCTSLPSHWRVSSPHLSGLRLSGKPTKRSSRIEEGKKRQTSFSYLYIYYSLTIEILFLCHCQGERSCLRHVQQLFSQKETLPQWNGTPGGCNSTTGHHTHTYTSRASGPQSPTEPRRGENREQEVKPYLCY